MKQLVVIFQLVILSIFAFSSCESSKKEERKQSIETHKISTNEPALETTPAPELSAPDFTLTNLKGDKFKLSEQKDKVVIINYWATFCGPCIKEIPDFIELQEEMSSEPVQFVGISNKHDKVEDVRSFDKEYKVNYPLLPDKENTFAEKYQSGFTAAPMTFLINHRGEVAHVITGRTNKKLLKPLITQLIALEQNS